MSVEVPAPFATVAGLNEHAGGAEFAGVMPQDSVTAALKPPVAEIVIVDVADAPGVTEAGEGATAVRPESYSEPPSGADREIASRGP